MRESKAIRRLRAAMAPDPSRWRYTGISRDTGEYGNGRCACGHPVRYEFLIERDDDGKRLVIGSHCIETNVPYLISVGAERLARDLQAANRDLQRELAAGRTVRERGLSGRLPISLEEIPALPKARDSAHEFAKAARRRYVILWWAGAEVAQRDELDLPPMPEEPRLLARLRSAIDRNRASPDARHHRTAEFVVAGGSAEPL